MASSATAEDVVNPLANFASLKISEKKSQKQRVPRNKQKKQTGHDIAGGKTTPVTQQDNKKKNATSANGASNSQSNMKKKQPNIQAKGKPQRHSSPSPPVTKADKMDTVRANQNHPRADTKQLPTQYDFHSIINASPICAMEPLLTSEKSQNELNNIDVIEGVLRVNIRNPEDAFVSSPIDAEGGKYQWDIYVEGQNNRGRALNGDQVAVKLLPRNKWKIQFKSIQQWEEANKMSLKDFMINRGISDGTMDSTSATESNLLLESPSSQSTTPNGRELPKQCGLEGNDGQRVGDNNATGSSKSSYSLDLILQHPEWGRFVQRTGRVIGMISESGSKVACGHLKLMPSSAWHDHHQQQQQQQRNQFVQRPQAAMFVPQDRRFPRLWIPAAQLPEKFFQRAQDYAQTLYCARLEQWPEPGDGHWEMPKGELLHLVGQSGDIEAETMAILAGQMVESDEFPEDILDDLPMDISSEWIIPPEELKSRRDFRRQLVVSIDPATARDIDDCVSVRQVEDDLFEVGVHIADLSYFIPAGCKLDKRAQKRATSVYLVQKVIPMLPRILCEQLCSLTPGSDKLTFSVVWKMNSKGEVFDEWFGRTVINSVCKLSYEHAQQMIDLPDHNWTAEELPEIHGNCWTASDISKMVNVLNEMAIAMRERRVENGCLRLDQIRLQFALADDGKTPQGFSVYEHSESHKLIEEFMLQANMAVAHKLVRHYPKMAFLRNHPPPDWRRLEATVRSCTLTNIQMNGKTSGELQKSLFRILDSSNRIQVVDAISSRLGRSDDAARDALMSALCNVLSKPFRPASYFVAGSLPTFDHYRHFALAVPLYTHFTSPIRRYADLIVHRLLAAAVDLAPCPYSEVAPLQRIAAHCNERKYAAKTAQDLSIELFTWAFVRRLPQHKMRDDFIVIGAFDKAVDLMSLTTGLIHRAYLDKQGGRCARFTNDPDCLIIVFNSKRGAGVEETLKLAPLAPVRGFVIAQPQMGKYMVILDPPPNALLPNN